MGSEEKTKKQPRSERLFDKLIWLPKDRKEEFEAMAEADNGKKLATWIQDNVGRFSELESIIKGYIDEDTKYLSAESCHGIRDIKTKERLSIYYKLLSDVGVTYKKALKK